MAPKRPFTIDTIKRKGLISSNKATSTNTFITFVLRVLTSCDAKIVAEIFRAHYFKNAIEIPPCSSANIIASNFGPHSIVIGGLI